jgi:hypothetical protein
MNTIHGPIILPQKEQIIAFCMECQHIILVTICSDGTWYGAHYLNYWPVTIQSNSGWMCEDCWNKNYPDEVKILPKEKIGFTMR